MSLSEMLEKPQLRPVRVTILGEAGVGKTSLANTFPNPVFVRFEDGMASLGAGAPPCTPVLTSTEEAMTYLNALGEDEHDFQTLVVDSVTALASICEREALEACPKGAKTLASAHGGYGAGFQFAAGLINHVFNVTTMLQRHRDMHVVYIAHAGTEVIEPVDSDPYMRLTLKMNKRLAPSFIDDVDVVGLLKLKAAVFGGGDRKKVKTDGTRILDCLPSPSSVSKNRFGVDQLIAVEHGVNPLTPFIPSLQHEA
jgi:hypothetical protein